MSHRLKGYFLLAVAVVLAATMNAKAASVLTTKVVREAVSDEIEALGTLKANESIQVTVPLAEFVSRIHFKEGQRVTKNQLLLELESNEEKALLQEAEYTLDEAASQLDRIKAVAKRGDASQSLLDERQREYNVAKARLAAIKSKLNDHSVKAPFSGLTGLRNISPGAYLTPGSVVTTLIDDSLMKLDFNVPGIYLNALQRGINITASNPAFVSEEFVGEVSNIDNRIDPVSRSITVRAILPNPKGVLKPGLLMQVKLITNQRLALTIPEEALLPKADQQFVIVVDRSSNNQVGKQVLVTTGSRWQGKVEILSGLKENMEVVIHGADKVRPNQTLNILTTINQ
ncbi:MAG: efflux RND transporter periplasmic adaptor subunit [Pseudomonadales bacterium]|nr:efflux RND transporter periplasmic adaptor subunit [Pseudomonadales bacterium]